MKISDNQKSMIAMLNGVRELNYSITTNTNLCYSNKEVIPSFVSIVVDYAKRKNELSLQKCLDIYRVTEVSSKYSGFGKKYSIFILKRCE